MTYQVFMSPAFRDLRPSARDVLTQLYYEIEMTSRTKQGKYVPTLRNRHVIKLPYNEIRQRLGYADKTIWSVFRQIMASGFIKVERYGGGAKGDVQVYGIAEDWRNWEKGQVIRKLKRNGKAGWQKAKKQAVL